MGCLDGGIYFFINGLDEEMYVRGGLIHDFPNNLLYTLCLSYCCLREPQAADS